MLNRSGERTGGVTQVVEHLLSKCEALEFQSQCHTSSPPPKKKLVRAVSLTCSWSLKKIPCYLWKFYRCFLLDWKKVASIPSFCWGFYRARVTCFFCIYWEDNGVYFLLLVMIALQINLTDYDTATAQKILYFSNMICYIAFSFYCMLNHPCIAGLNTTWSWCVIFFMCCLIWFARLMRILTSIFIKDISL
jgi:hypothetical protein